MASQDGAHDIRVLLPKLRIGLNVTGKKVTVPVGGVSNRDKGLLALIEK